LKTLDRWSYPRWFLSLFAMMNFVIAILRAARNNDMEGWMSFATIALALVTIVVASVRLQTGFSHIAEGTDEKTVRRLQQNASSLAFMAILGIFVALTFIPRR